MRPARFLPLGAAVCLLVVSGQEDAHSQWGVLNLPQHDFTWVWGNRARAEARRGNDLSLTGTDSGFQCELTARLSPGSRLTRMDVRQIENDIRVSMSFIETSARTMNNLDYYRELDWAVLECARLSRDDGPVEATGPESVTAWIELEVRIAGQFGGPQDAGEGEWAASYTQAGAWRLRRSGSGRRATHTIRSEGLLLPGALANVEGSAEATCRDAAGTTWRTEWEGPVQAEPINLTSGSEGGELVLWATVPDVWMQHPGHGHLPRDSACRTAEEPFRDRLSLDAAALRRAGATLNDDGAVRLGALSWAALSEAALGRGPEVELTMHHEAAGAMLEIRATIGERTN
jgi:hypothetical protein